MYSLNFATDVSRICMDEIRRRGLKERKILRKSVPNSVLLLKVFRKQNCTAEDLTHVSIHSVATLMQDTLWCCQERIVPKKVWRVINYETCTLDDLSQYINQKGKNLLLEILDFLVELMKYKDSNQMDAYHLGEAMGKVTLGPADCDPIIAEKAGHFLTRMIIEHSKHLKGMPPSKSEAAKSKAKSYNRLIKKIHARNHDWLTVVDVALYAMLENEYEQEQLGELNEPYLSIFSKQLDPVQAMTSPVLFKLITEASKAIEPIPLDPFAESYLFHSNRKLVHQIRVAFDDFVPLLQTPVHNYAAVAEKMTKPQNNMKMKLLRKPKDDVPVVEDAPMMNSPTSMIDNGSSYSNKTLYSSEDFNNNNNNNNNNSNNNKKHSQMKNMMKKVIKIGNNKKVSHHSIY